MIRHIGMLHTVGFIADMFRQMVGEAMPDVQCTHVVDEGILAKLMESGGLTPAVVRRVATQAGLLMESGADLILFTCSSTSPAVDLVRPLIDTPIMKIDEPLADMAVETGQRIGVITTAKTTLKPSVDLVQSRADRVGKPVEIVSTLEAEAFEARLAGNIDVHDRLIEAAIDKFSNSCDVVVLAQASMAHIADQSKDRYDVPILAGPKLCLAALKSMVDEAG